MTKSVDNLFFTQRANANQEELSWTWGKGMRCRQCWQGKNLLTKLANLNKFCYWKSSVIRTTAAAKSLQSCPTLCDPMDCSLPGFSVHGILQARTLEWVTISFSNAWKWKVKVKSLSCVRHVATPWTAAYQAPSSMGFSMQQYWSGVPLPSPLRPS